MNSSYSTNLPLAKARRWFAIASLYMALIAAHGAIQAVDTGGQARSRDFSPDMALAISRK